MRGETDFTFLYWKYKVFGQFLKKELSISMRANSFYWDLLWFPYLKKSKFQAWIKNFTEKEPIYFIFTRFELAKLPKIS